MTDPKQQADDYWAAFTAYDVPDEKLAELFEHAQQGDTDLSEGDSDDNNILAVDFNA